MKNYKNFQNERKWKVTRPLIGIKVPEQLDFLLCLFVFNSSNYMEQKSIFVSNCHVETGGLCFDYPNCNIKK